MFKTGIHKFKAKAAGASLALAAIAGGSVLLPTQALAQQPTHLGNALIFPYYTVLDGWQTLLNVTNVTDNAVAVKVRLHESENSRDVLDFYVLLSPKDVWTAWLVDDGNGRARLQTNDRSCTVPISVRDSGVNTSEIAFQGDFEDEGTQSTARMSEGYVEMLVVGEADPANQGDDFTDGTIEGAPYYSIHVNGEPRDCTEAQSFFTKGYSWDPSSDAAHVPGSGYPEAAYGDAVYQYAPVTYADTLKGNVSYVNPARGLAAGTEAIAMSGWGVLAGGPNEPASGPGVNAGTAWEVADDNDGADDASIAGHAPLLTAQEFPFFLEPTLASDATGIWTNDYTTIDTFLEAALVTNEWANNPSTGAQTDWVMTFPTKGGHVDYVDEDEDDVDDHVQAGCNRWRNDGANVAAVAGGIAVNCDATAAGYFEEDFDGQSNITVEYTLYDREEATTTVVADGVSVSPAPPPDVIINSMPYEANVIAVGNSDVGEVSSILASPNALTVDTSVISGTPNNGFMEISFTNTGDDDTAGPLPLTGFVLKVRDFGDPALSYGQILKHSLQ